MVRILKWRGWWACTLLWGMWLAACTEAAPGGFGNDVLFHDEFAAGQAASWQIEGDDLGQTAIVNEQLMIDIRAANVMQFASLPEMPFQDFVLEVEARQVGGDLANSYGVLFRMQDPNRFYRFDITGDGKFMLERRNGDGTWTRFIRDWLPTPAIQQGHNAVNRLRVEVVGPSISTYVNDTFLFQVNDTAYAAGTIALDAGTFGGPEMQATFDNVVVRRP